MNTFCTYCEVIILFFLSLSSQFTGKYLLFLSYVIKDLVQHFSTESLTKSAS